MPPTTGGSTSGSRISERTTRMPGNRVRASTRAIGTPNTRHSSVDTVEVCRLSFRAASDDAAVISSTKRDQSTREIIATSGKITSTAPSPAGR